MGCLALNASYEPLTIIPVRRAVRLLIDRKADALEVDSERPIRSERVRMDTPVVIRLVRFIQIPRRFRRQVTTPIAVSTAVVTGGSWGIASR